MTIQPAHYSECGCMTAQGDRQVLSSLVCSEGVALDQGGGLQVQPAIPANMTVKVSSGNAFIEGDNIDWQGMYHVSNDGTATLPVIAADPAQDRIDLVIAEVQDSQYSGTACNWQLRVVAGTPASPPTIPSTPINAIALASFTVSANSTTVPAVNDLRFAYALCQSALPQVTRPTKITVTNTTRVIDFINTYPWCKRAVGIVCGAGGAGGGAEATISSGVVSFGGGGGGGAYCRVEIIPSLVTGGQLTATAGPGGTGILGDSGNFGADSVLTDGVTAVTAGGGVGGEEYAGSSSSNYPGTDPTGGVSSGSGSTGWVGELEVFPGLDGTSGSNNGAGNGRGGDGGSSHRGGGGFGKADQTSGPGGAGDNPGGGGGGGYNGPSQTAQRIGGAGGPGVIVLYLYDH